MSVRFIRMEFSSSLIKARLVVGLGTTSLERYCFFIGLGIPVNNHFYSYAEVVNVSRWKTQRIDRIVQIARSEFNEQKLLKINNPQRLSRRLIPRI